MIKCCEDWIGIERWFLFEYKRGHTIHIILVDPRILFQQRIMDPQSNPATIP